MGKILAVLALFLFCQNSYAVKSSCRESYVPEYDMDLLLEIKDWAAAGAFLNHAKDSIYDFDVEAFRADNPNPAVFNFGRATGTSCLEVDVMTGYVSALWALDNLKRILSEESDDFELEFSKELYKRAVKWGVEAYLIKSDEGTQTI